MWFHDYKTCEFIFCFHCYSTGITEQACRSNESFPPVDQFVLEDVNYIKPVKELGYLVIVPEMRFNCHGYITGWSAVTRLNSSENIINNLGHYVTFQLWRPSTRGSGIYNFVGSQALKFVNNTLRPGLNIINATQFFTFISVQVSGEKLFFQPGDVVGWYIHSTVQEVGRTLSIVYRDLSNSSSNSINPNPQPVDMYVTEVANTTTGLNTPPPCEVSLDICNSFFRFSSVLPYVTVDFGKYTSTISVNTCNY